MVTRYVDPSAAVSGTGLTTADPLNVLPANFSSAGWVNGDVILLKRGTTYTPAWSGVDGDAFVVNRVVRIGAYGTGDKPVIRSAFTGTNNGKMFRLYSGAVAFEDIRWQDTAGITPIYGQNAIDGPTIDRCEFIRIRGDNVTKQNAINLGAAGAMTGLSAVRDCLFEDICNDAISIVSAGTIIVDRNTIRRPSVDADNGDCVAVQGNCNVFVRKNRLDHSNRDTKQCIIQDAGSTGFAVIEDNICIGYMGSDSVNHTGIYVTMPGVIRRNRVSTWRSGIYCNGPNILVSDNLVLQGGGSATTGAIYGTSAGMKVRGNTIVRIAGATDLADAAIRNTLSDATNDYRGNLIVGFSRGIRRGALAVETHNAFWQVTQSVLDGAGSVTAAAGSDITSDPQINTDYRPLRASPLLAAGVHLGYRRDIDGKQRRKLPSIGAYDVATFRRTP
jgi:hypothetical protein